MINLLSMIIIIINLMIKIELSMWKLQLVEVLSQKYNLLSITEVSHPVDLHNLSSIPTFHNGNVPDFK